MGIQKTRKESKAMVLPTVDELHDKRLQRNN